MLTIKMKSKTLAYLSIFLIITIVITIFSISFHLVGSLYSFLQTYIGIPIAEFLINSIFLLLSGLLWLTYRRWKQAAKKRVELENIVDSISPDVLMVVDRDMNIILCNASVKRMFGYEVDEVVNQKTGFLYLDRRSKPEQHYEIFHTLEQEGFHIGLATGRKKNGITMPLEVVAGKVSGRGGAVLLLRDMTEYKRAAQAQQKSEEKYHTLVESIEDGIANVDEKENFVFANGAAARIFGYSNKEELTGKNLREFTTSEEFKRVLKETSLRRAGKSSRYELTIHRKDGESRIIAVTATPVIGDDGSYRGGFEIFHDITECKRAEEERAKLESQLHQSQTTEP